MAIPLAIKVIGIFGVICLLFIPWSAPSIPASASLKQARTKAIRTQRTSKSTSPHRLVDNYETFLPKGRYSPVTDSLGVSAGLVEERSKAYLIRSNPPVLEFSPGIDCNLSHRHHWAICESSENVLQVTPKAFKFNIPLRTAWNESSGSLIDRLLHVAWGQTPPHIDIVIRTGALAAFEVTCMLESLVLFWPRFLGEVIIVLDEADRSRRQAIVPDRFALTHRLRIVYESTPCLPGRIFNQISNPILADHYSKAPIIAFIDSDVVFTAPVTPDFLFSGERP